MSIAIRTTIKYDYFWTHETESMLQIQALMHLNAFRCFIN